MPKWCRNQQSKISPEFEVQTLQQNKSKPRPEPLQLISTFEPKSVEFPQQLKTITNELEQPLQINNLIDDQELQQDSQILLTKYGQQNEFKHTGPIKEQKVNDDFITKIQIKQQQQENLPDDEFTDPDAPESNRPLSTMELPQPIERNVNPYDIYKSKSPSRLPKVTFDDDEPIVQKKPDLKKPIEKRVAEQHISNHKLAELGKLQNISEKVRQLMEANKESNDDIDQIDVSNLRSLEITKFTKSQKQPNQPPKKVITGLNQSQLKSNLNQSQLNNHLHGQQGQIKKSPATPQRDSISICTDRSVYNKPTAKLTDFQRQKLKTQKLAQLTSQKLPVARIDLTSLDLMGPGKNGRK